jgi:hypothetical protein
MDLEPDSMELGWKPVALSLCQGLTTHSNDVFYEQKKQQLDKHFNEFGLQVRSVRHEDYDKLMAFAKLHYSDHAQLTGFFMYLMVSFGSSILLVNSKDQIKGYILEATFQKYQISHGASMAVDPALKGKSIGRDLFTYSAILSMKYGAKEKYGFVSLDNYSSIISLVNGCGAAIVDFCEDLYGLGPKFILKLPLEAKVLNSTPLDPLKLDQMVQDRDENIQVIDAKKLESVKEMLQQAHMIIGFHKGYFLAISVKYVNPKYLIMNFQSIF